MDPRFQDVLSVMLGVDLAGMKEQASKNEGKAEDFQKQREADEKKRKEEEERLRKEEELKNMSADQK